MRIGDARVLVPRAADDPISLALAATGAEVVPARLTATLPLEVDPARVDPAGAAWVLVTSARTVDRLAELETAARTWPRAVEAARSGGTRVGSVGPATTAALAHVGVTVDTEASHGTAASLIETVGAPAEPGPTRVLLPASALADPTTAARLTGRGWDVDAVAVYTTVTDTEAARAAVDPWPDAVVVTAPSTLRALLETAGAPPRDVRLVAIGPTTADALRDTGLAPSATAAAPTPEAIATATADALRSTT
ncbi:MAG: uroporphyrinogen-III synthase [Actinomycetales bacterium]